MLSVSTLSVVALLGEYLNFRLDVPVEGHVEDGPLEGAAGRFTSGQELGPM